MTSAMTKISKKTGSDGQYMASIWQSRAYTTHAFLMKPRSPEASCILLGFRSCCHGQEALRPGLPTMSTVIVELACISVPLLERPNSKPNEPRHRMCIAAAVSRATGRSNLAAAIAAQGVDGAGR